MIDVEPQVYNENSFEERISCGRTKSRGNWVKIMKNGFSICLSSDGEKPFSQIRLKEMCLEILNKFASGRGKQLWILRIWRVRRWASEEKRIVSKNIRSI